VIVLNGMVHFECPYGVSSILMTLFFQSYHLWIHVPIDAAGGRFRMSATSYVVFLVECRRNLEFCAFSEGAMETYWGERKKAFFFGFCFFCRCLVFYRGRPGTGMPHDSTATCHVLAGLLPRILAAEPLAAHLSEGPAAVGRYAR